MCGISRNINDGQSLNIYFLFWIEDSISSLSLITHWPLTLTLDHWLIN